MINNDLYILDENRRVVPCPDFTQWAIARGKAKLANSWRVARTEFRGADVSTVFLGMDHRSILQPGEPLVFETMVFGGPQNGLIERCSTWEQAEEQHRNICAELERRTLRVINGDLS